MQLKVNKKKLYQQIYYSQHQQANNILLLQYTTFPQPPSPLPYLFFQI